MWGAPRWNGKIDHVSHLNNISDRTTESRGLAAYVYWIFSESKEPAVVPCLLKGMRQKGKGRK